MIFGATTACPTCALRFTRRDTCPRCGGSVVALTDQAGRTAVQRGGQHGGASTFMLMLGRWAPSKPWLTIAIGVLLALPAFYALVFDPNMLKNLWFVDDRSSGELQLYTEYAGLSARGLQVLLLGAAGLLLTAFSVLAWLGQRTRPGQTKKLVIHEPAVDHEAADGREEVTGIAKLATTEIQSPLGAEACLAFGLRGEVDGTEVDDADGGDFDLVLPDGSMMMVSLEHAKLQPFGDEKAIPLTVAEAAELEDFLIERVGHRVRESCTLQETILAEGDTVTVIGTFQGLAVGTAPFRSAGRGRVLGGDPERPLLARVVKRAANTALD